MARNSRVKTFWLNLLTDALYSYAEPEGARALPNVIRAPDMTREKCASLCPNNKYHGVEWGQECW